MTSSILAHIANLDRVLNNISRVDSIRDYIVKWGTDEHAHKKPGSSEMVFWNLFVK